VVTIIMFGNTY